MAGDILTLQAPPADYRIPWGPGELQFGDLRLPPGPGPHPAVIVIHGGYWRAAYDLLYAGHMSAALTRRFNKIQLPVPADIDTEVQIVRKRVQEIGTGLRLPGRSVPENDQRQIQAADRLGFEGRSAALWRNPHRPVARLDRKCRDCAARAQP